jgi:hypothetical protein
MAAAAAADLEEMIPAALHFLASQEAVPVVDAVQTTDLILMAQLQLLVQHVGITVQHLLAVVAAVDPHVTLERQTWLINVLLAATVLMVLSLLVFQE